MRRRSILASAVAIGAAALCAGLALAFEGSGIEGHVVVGGGGGHVAGDNLVEGRSVSVDRLNGSASWGGFHSACFPYGYSYPYPSGLYGVCPPK